MWHQGVVVLAVVALDTLLLLLLLLVWFVPQPVEVRVLQGLGGRGSFLRVQFEQQFHKGHGFLADFPKVPLFQSLRAEHLGHLQPQEPGILLETLLLMRGQRT